MRPVLWKHVEQRLNKEKTQMQPTEVIDNGMFIGLGIDTSQHGQFSVAIVEAFGRLHHVPFQNMTFIYEKLPTNRAEKRKAVKRNKK